MAVAVDLHGAVAGLTDVAIRTTVPIARVGRVNIAVDDDCGVCHRKLSRKTESCREHKQNELRAVHFCLAFLPAVGA